MASTIKQRLRRYNGTDYDTIHLETQAPQVLIQDSTLQTELGTTVEAAMSSLKTSVSSGKASVAQAVTDKGVTTASDASFSTIATNIGSINTRTDGTLDSNDKLLVGYTAYGSGGTKYTGTLPDTSSGGIANAVSGTTCSFDATYAIVTAYNFVTSYQAAYPVSYIIYPGQSLYAHSVYVQTNQQVLFHANRNRTNAFYGSVPTMAANGRSISFNTDSSGIPANKHQVVLVRQIGNPQVCCKDIELTTNTHSRTASSNFASKFCRIYICWLGTTYQAFPGSFSVALVPGNSLTLDLPYEQTNIGYAAYQKNSYTVDMSLSADGTTATVTSSIAGIFACTFYK